MSKGLNAVELNKAIIRSFIDTNYRAAQVLICEDVLVSSVVEYPSAGLVKRLGNIVDKSNQQRLFLA